VTAVRDPEAVRRRIRQTLARTARPDWQPPQLSDFGYYRTVLAFDAALRNTGWVILVSTPSRGISVIDHGTIRMTTLETSYLATWDLAVSLKQEVCQVMRRQLAPVDDVVAEAPSVGGGHRTESSLVAGLQVWQEAREHGKPLIPVAADHASSVLCGNRSHDKKEIAAAVARYVPGSAKRDWTEHERDAAAVALAYLYDRVHRVRS
jgi:Holliday junction resolvasome RuvABC endonuclease subunit